MRPPLPCPHPRSHPHPPSKDERGRRKAGQADGELAWEAARVPGSTEVPGLRVGRETEEEHTLVAEDGKSPPVMWPLLELVEQIGEGGRAHWAAGGDADRAGAAAWVIRRRRWHG